VLTPVQPWAMPDVGWQWYGWLVNSSQKQKLTQ
jgi:hypothetical protein